MRGEKNINIENLDHFFPFLSSFVGERSRENLSHVSSSSGLCVRNRLIIREGKRDEERDAPNRPPFRSSLSLCVCIHASRSGIPPNVLDAPYFVSFCLSGAFT